MSIKVTCVVNVCATEAEAASYGGARALSRTVCLPIAPFPGIYIAFQTVATRGKAASRARSLDSIEFAFPSVEFCVGSGAYCVSTTLRPASQAEFDAACRTLQEGCGFATGAAPESSALRTACGPPAVAFELAVRIDEGDITFAILRSPMEHPEMPQIGEKWYFRRQYDLNCRAAMNRLSKTPDGRWRLGWHTSSAFFRPYRVTAWANQEAVRYTAAQRCPGSEAAAAVVSACKHCLGFVPMAADAAGHRAAQLAAGGWPPGP
ncbi:MAG: hypothetical protein KGJ62_03200 [Armatimonadetes bacterium]|nr:hypothetical protein [Armatimonadota bacterium]